MRVCFPGQEVSFHNHEIIFAYSNTMNKIGLILSGRLSCITAMKRESVYD